MSDPAHRIEEPVSGGSAVFIPANGKRHPRGMGGPEAETFLDPAASRMGINCSERYR
ncbi:MAG: hypothetical protein M0Q42_13265 [Xanthomonadales bacterium]|nr:hypothetical protein [Xanthomonadales bacterium]